MEVTMGKIRLMIVDDEVDLLAELKPLLVSAPAMKCYPLFTVNRPGNRRQGKTRPDRAGYAHAQAQRARCAAPPA
jgi:hypothetical protein